jgi:hypothetical protein
MVVYTTTLWVPATEMLKEARTRCKQVLHGPEGGWPLPPTTSATQPVVVMSCVKQTHCTSPTIPLGSMIGPSDSNAFEFLNVADMLLAGRSGLERLDALRIINLGRLFHPLHCWQPFPRRQPCHQQHANMKYVLVTGGVVSGLGKGVTASSIGVLLKNCGLRVTSIKIGKQQQQQHRPAAAPWLASLVLLRAQTLT